MKVNIYIIVCSFLVLMNLLSFIAFAADKKKAEQGRWRTPESTLLSLAFFGGGFGAFLGMHLYHHKTKKWKFRILVPLFMMIQSILLLYFFLNI